MLMTSITAATPATTCRNCRRYSGGRSERDQSRALGVERLPADALDVVERNALPCALQARCIDRLHLELQRLTVLGDDFHAIVRLKLVRQLRGLDGQRLRGHASEHRKTR